MIMQDHSWIYSVLHVEKSEYTWFRHKKGKQKGIMGSNHQFCKTRKRKMLSVPFISETFTAEK